MKTLKNLSILTLLLSLFFINSNAESVKSNLPEDYECLICEQLNAIEAALLELEEMDYKIPTACKILASKIESECYKENPRIDLMINWLDKLLKIVRAPFPSLKIVLMKRHPILIIIYNCEVAIDILYENS